MTDSGSHREQLRDALGEIVSRVCEERFGSGCCFKDDTGSAVFPERAAAMRAEDLEVLLSALLDAGLLEQPTAPVRDPAGSARILRAVARRIDGRHSGVDDSSLLRSVAKQLEGVSDE